MLFTQVYIGPMIVEAFLPFFVQNNNLSWIQKLFEPDCYCASINPPRNLLDEKCGYLLLQQHGLMGIVSRG
jgi:hypothetical protein